MGIVRKIKESELVGGRTDKDVYPVTSTTAVFDKSNKSLDEVLNELKNGVDNTLSNRVTVAYKSSPTPPPTPVGGSWDIHTGEVTLPEGWSKTDKLEPPIWMSTGEFLATAPNNPTWSFPMPISGKNGKNGEDGSKIEFIYKLTKNDLDVPNRPISINEDDRVPIEEGWSDNPSSISPEMQVEWFCFRYKKTDKWDEWSDPAIWSKWGVNGQDGDGVEYIYFRNRGEVVPNPTPVNTDTDEYQERGQYEGKEYIPQGGWTDNPKGISLEFTHEWVSKRVRKKSVWGAFSDPALWSKDGEKGQSGISMKTMYAKTSGSHDTPVVISDKENPGSIWGLAFPHYEGIEAVWQIQAYFTYDGKLAEVKDSEGHTIKGWQGPWICTGANGKDSAPMNYKTYVYAKSNSIPNKPTSDDPKNPGTSTNASGEIVTWKDYPSGEGQWYQSIGVVNGKTELIDTDENGQLKWGKPIPVNGKDGVGKDGRYTELRFKKSLRESMDDLSEDERNNPTPIGWDTIPPKIQSEENLFMISAIKNADGTLYQAWSNPTRINGEKGPQGYTGPAGRPGPTGSQGVSGIHGVTMLNLYCAGQEKTFNARVKNPQDIVTDGDDLSLLGGWTWGIPTTNEGSPYVWSIQGNTKYKDYKDTIGKTTWSKPFRLSGVNGLGQDGVSIIGVDEYYQYSTLPSGLTIGMGEWSKNEVPTPKSEEHRYLWNYEVIHYDQNKPDKVTPPAVIGSMGLRGPRGLQGLQGDRGLQGIPGNTGPSGISSYFHIKYSVNSNGNPMTETPSTFIGTKVDHNPKDSPNYWDYDWHRLEGIQGPRGDQGIPGVGKNGETAYLHIKYSNDGGSSFTGHNGEDVGSWIGQYTDHTPGDSNYPSNYKWSKIKGETGDTGPIGPHGRGITGITEKYLATNLDSGVNSSTSGWTTTVQKTSNSKPYLWNWEHITYNMDPKSEDFYTIIGTHGAEGKKGQIIYPAGVYAYSTTYKATDEKAPYVYHSSTGNYYVLNVVGSNIQGCNPPDYPQYWTKMESFEAIYAKIGIIANGLVGSAVFNGDFMFSQQGSGSGSYEHFNKNDPMNPNNSFIPNICLNFRTGEVWFSRGNVHFDTNGNADFKGKISSGATIGGMDVTTDSIEFESGIYKMKLGSGHLSFLERENAKCNISTNGIVVKDGYGIYLEGEQSNIKYPKVPVSKTPGISEYQNSYGDLGESGFIINKTSYTHTYNMQYGSSGPGRIVYVKNVGGGKIVLNGTFRNADQPNTHSGMTITDPWSRIFVYDGSAWNEFCCIK